MIQTLIIDLEKFNTDPKFFEDLIMNFYHNNGDNFTREELKISTQLNNGVFYSVAINDGQILSLARLSTVEVGGSVRKTMIILRQIDTLKAFRNKGYASNVIQNVVEYLKNTKCKKILSMAYADNSASIQMHLKNGFKICKPTKSFQKTRYYFDGVYFEKELQ